MATTTRQKQPRRSRRLPYAEGSWFQVPLAPGGPVAVGVAARIDGTGGLLGYFFLLDQVPTVAQLSTLKASDAQQVLKLGDLALMKGQWPILADPLPGWDREQWPLPEFKLFDDLRNRWEIRTYDDRLRPPIKIREASDAEVKDLPKDGTCGAGAVEDVIKQLVGRNSPVKVRRLAA